MTDKPKPTIPRQIFDVSHPSKTKALATSKPVIVTNRAIMKDPMMADSIIPEDEPSNVAKPTGEPVIQPLAGPGLFVPLAAATAKAPNVPSDDEPEAEIPEETTPEQEAETKETADEEVDATTDEQPTNIEESDQPEKDTNSDEVTKEDDKKQPAKEPAKEDASDDETDETDETKDESKGKVDDKAINLEAEAEKQAARDAELQKLVDSKKYFLSIDSVNNQRTKRFVVLGILLSLILAVAWVDIALDAGLIHLDNIKPLTHFFSS